MPAIVGPIQFVNVGGGVVHIGDSLNIAPKSNSKAFNGSGSFNTGGFIVTNNGINFTNTADIDGIDQPTIGNG